MTFELFPWLTPWLYGFLAVAAVAVVVSVAIIGDFVVTNRKARVARHESVRTYYGRLTFSH